MSYHRGQTLTLVVAMTMILMIPLAVHQAADAFQRQSLQRAKSTPLIVGAKGSRFGLAMHGLYFRGNTPEVVPLSELRRIEATHWGRAIGILARYRAAGFPIVGTSEEYLSFRGLSVVRGDCWQRLGDCVIGASVARQLKLSTDDRLLSEPDNAFDLASPPPLSMRVTGVLPSSGTADDEAIFVSLRTAWVLEGIGHGHSVQAEGSISEHEHGASRANLTQYTEVTAENEESFHFHGRAETYPLTAILVLPESDKGETLLVGQFLDPNQGYQVLRPQDVIEELLLVIARLRQFVSVLVMALVTAACLLLVLVVGLSVRLRLRELETMWLLGSSPWTATKIVGLELLIEFLISSGLAMGLFWATSSLSSNLVRYFLNI
jgi:putative ABC transport system permease protein